MKLKLFIWILLLIPLFLSGQTNQIPNFKYLSITGDSILIAKYSDINKLIYSFKKGRMDIDTVKSTIYIGQNFAIINEPYARQDLQRDQVMKTSLWLDSIIIAEQQEELARKDTLISDQNKLISDLNQRYLAVSDMVVVCEKDRKKKTFAAKIFKWSFLGMCGVAFVLGVK